MITILQICEAIRALIVRDIPEIKQIHLDLLPEGHERPSALIVPISRTVEDASMALAKVMDKLRIAIIDEVNAYGLPNTEQSLALQAKACALFASGFLRVEGRALHALAGLGERERDTVFVDITLDYFDDRLPPVPQPESMETVEAKLTAKG